MKRILLILALMISGCTTAFAQIDTLFLAETAEIVAPANIVRLYAADIQGDSSKELVLCSANNVFVYNSITREIIWTSPWLIGPGNVSFYDVDGDGHQDVAMADSLNLLIFSGADFHLLWASPRSRNPLKCYALGDENNDGLTDIVVVTKEIVDYPRLQDWSNRDTVWIGIYNGPRFADPDTVLILMSNFHHLDMRASYRGESPAMVVITRLSSAGGLEDRIVLFSSVTTGSYGHGGVSGSAYNGSVYIIHSDDLDVVPVDTVGRIIAPFVISDDRSNVMYFLNDKGDQGSGPPPQGSWEHRYARIGAIENDSSRFLTQFWSSSQDTSWGGVIVGEIDQLNPGLEMCFGAGHRLSLRSFPSLSTRWTVAYPSGMLLKLFRDNALYERTQIMSGSPGYLFDVANGNFDAYFSGQGVTLNDVVDLDNDGRDELLSIRNNSLNIYHAQRSGLVIPDFAKVVVDSNFDGALSLWPADIDGDGDKDIVSAGGRYSWRGEISWWENSANAGSFSKHIVENYLGPSALCVSDLDNDGDSDIMTSSVSDSILAWWENSGTGSFTRHNLSGLVTAYCIWLQPADLDLDGDMDVAAAVYYHNRIVWLENDGNRNFTSHDVSTRFDSPRTLDVADFNNDGHVDILASSYTGNKISWFENDGSQLFAPRTVVDSVAGPLQILARDFDLDGDKDVICASHGGGKILWWENGGWGAFSEQHIVSPSFANAYSIATGDFDNDGNIDIAGTSAGSTVAWWQNTSHQTYLIHTLNTQFTLAEWINAADMDNDGDLDIIADAYDLRQIALWRNGLNATGIAPDEEGEPHHPNRASLEANYPNPFNNSTIISYNPSESADVEIDIYDILGRKIHTFRNSNQQAGRHQTVWDAKDMSSGPYFYRIRAGDFAETRMMLLLK